MLRRSASPSPQPCRASSRPDTMEDAPALANAGPKTQTLQDEVVKYLPRAPAITDVENEELRSFCNGMSPWPEAAAPRHGDFTMAYLIPGTPLTCRSHRLEDNWAYLISVTWWDAAGEGHREMMTKMMTLLFAGQTGGLVRCCWWRTLRDDDKDEKLLGKSSASMIVPSEALLSTPGISGCPHEIAWEVTFSDFNSSHDRHAAESVAFLWSRGLDFDQARARSVSSTAFVEKLVAALSSAASWCEGELTWAVFGGAYDFGYLIKMLAGGGWLRMMMCVGIWLLIGLQMTTLMTRGNTDGDGVAGFGGRIVNLMSRESLAWASESPEGSVRGFSRGRVKKRPGELPNTAAIDGRNSCFCLAGVI
ncbi:hypothetical protein U9M48_004170 [Paspalum notatum var. saurae]|uniref:Uncharacterized protein n=1 Tax=Paspalum notatum var. saurae TaxID=547442 RepID=A0AAQ3PU95_PASNO